MAGTWGPLHNQPSFNADTMLLLTDGTVMCHELSSSNWHQLKPDSHGDYTNGTWSQLASLPDNTAIPAAVGGPTNAPLYFASAVLADGTVFVAGGEYNSGNANADTIAAQIYDPLSDSWTTIDAPTGWAQIGDAPTCVMPDGRLMLGNISSQSVAIYDPVLQIWTTAANKGDNSSEETFTLLPNNTILTVQCSNIPNAEKYLIASDQWVAAGSTSDTLPQACPGFVAEIGPAILLPNGSVFAIGATGKTGIYTPPANASDTDHWSAGPTLTDSSNHTQFPMDAGAVLLPNGKVLCVGSPTPPCNYPGPTTFFEYDSTSNTAAVITAPTNNGSACYFGRFLLLPTGQVLFSNNTADIEVYTPDGHPDTSWKPTISTCPASMVPGHTYVITGTQFNGLSQACSYGDDAQMATNYPLVRLTNTLSHEVVYVRTSNHSTMGVATGNTPQSTHMQVPYSISAGHWDLVVVANGIASDPFGVDIVEQDCFFILDHSTFGQGEIQALINQNGTPAEIDPALYIVVEGFSPNDLGLTTANLHNPPHRPSISDPTANVSLVFSGSVIPQDSSLPNHAQRFTFPYKIVFQDATPFNFGPTILPLPLTAMLTAAGATVVSHAAIELIKNPNPYILHGDTAHGFDWYLSVDIRVFQMKAGQRKFAVQVANSGAAQTVATAFISQAITNLNNSPAAADAEFNTLPQDEPLSSLALAPTDIHGVPVYNFAVARVRYRDIQPASNVRLFFRMWPAQQTNATYDTSTTYRRWGSNPNGQPIPLLGIQGDEIMTIPFFASPRIDSTTASMTTQTDTPNIQPTIQPDALGGEVDRYFGCWLDINQPGDMLFPSRITRAETDPLRDGPFTGQLFSIQQLVRSEHQCLLAEIAFDPDVIPPAADPSTSDKLAQRNLTFVNVPNPGVLESRRAPQTFEMRPTPRLMPINLKPDELMIEWGNTPPDSIANIYLPEVNAANVLLLAEQMYSSHRLTRLDAHTLQTPTGGITYIPIPKGTDTNFAGLLTIDLPTTVKKGQVYKITVRQITNAAYALNRNTEVRLLDSVRTAQDSFDKRDPIIWKRVLGSFNLTIPVSTKAELLGPEERLLSVLRWIEKTIPTQNRWYLVFRRYVEQIADRVQFMGGDPTLVLASPNGQWRTPHEIGSTHGHRGEERIKLSGKVAGIVYDRFGDFEGFLLDTEEEEHRFNSREPEVESLVLRAWKERIYMIVFVERDDLHRPMSIILR